MVKTSCENNYDNLVFLVDGVEKTFFTGVASEWQEYSCDITGSGTHILKWDYVKDQSVSQGEDCCWIDSVVWTPAAE